MKPLLLPLLLAVGLLGSSGLQAGGVLQSVNALAGDAGYVFKHGHLPDASASEAERIGTHLAYAESVLQAASVAGLSEAQRSHRAHIIRLLNDYRIDGVFPRNYDYPEGRMPCFIDQDGRICAVGYLIEQTAGREAAEAINAKFKYAYLSDMNDALIEAWMAEHGLTREECALIQPAYGWDPIYPEHSGIAPIHGIASGTLGGLNTGASLLCIIDMAKGRQSKVLPWIGMAGGALSLAYGSVYFSGRGADRYFGRPNETGDWVTMGNIGLGTFTLFMSACAKWGYRGDNRKDQAWNIGLMPPVTGSQGAGFYAVRRF